MKTYLPVLILLAACAHQPELPQLTNRTRPTLSVRDAFGVACPGADIGATRGEECWCGKYFPNGQLFWFAFSCTITAPEAVEASKAWREGALCVMRGGKPYAENEEAKCEMPERPVKPDARSRPFPTGPTDENPDELRQRCEQRDAAKKQELDKLREQLDELITHNKL